MNTANYIDLGVKDYKETWDYQEAVLKRIVEGKLSGKNDQELAVIFVEHPHVYTLGKSGVDNNLLINDTFLKKINATYYKINRGGDITYHGPGQVVGYPILDLERLNLGVKKYVYFLEQSIIDTLNEYNIIAERYEGSTGVWIDTQVKGKARKICAIGIRVSRNVSMHGFALNVNTNLEYFTYINPCGFVDKGVTSMEKELGKKLDMDGVKASLKRNLSKNLNVELS